MHGHDLDHSCFSLFHWSLRVYIYKGASGSLPDLSINQFLSHIFSLPARSFSLSLLTGLCACLSIIIYLFVCFVCFERKTKPGEWVYGFRDICVCDYLEGKHVTLEIAVEDFVRWTCSLSFYVFVLFLNRKILLLLSLSLSLFYHYTVMKLLFVSFLSLSLSLSFFFADLRLLFYLVVWFSSRKKEDMNKWLLRRFQNHQHARVSFDDEHR